MTSDSIKYCPCCARPVHPKYFIAVGCENVYCIDCRRKEPWMNRELTKQSRFHQGLCQFSRCADSRYGELPYCITHYLNKLGTKHRLPAGLLPDLYEKQKGMCVYTKERLIPGVNLSVDHIYPVSRFPELRGVSSNIQLITRRVNGMKQDYTPDEFAVICSKIVEHFS